MISRWCRFAARDLEKPSRSKSSWKGAVMPETKDDIRKNILLKKGASEAEINELLEFNSGIFDYSNLETEISFPLDDELFIKSWRNYEEEAKSIGVFPVIRKAIPHLNFPINDKIADNPEYKDAVLYANIKNERLKSNDLELVAPVNFQMAIVPTDAGSIPLLYIPERKDFIAVYSAVKNSNNPMTVPDKLTSALIRDIRNSERINQYKERFMKKKSLMNLNTTWRDEFSKLLLKKELYLDSFIIISGGNAANVKPEDAGYPKDEWNAVSIVINREKAILQYYMKRIFQVEKLHPYLELIAFYHALKIATKKFSADLLIKLMLPDTDKPTDIPACGIGASEFKLSPNICDILRKLIIASAENLEAFEKIYSNELANHDPNLLLISLTYITLEELSSTIEPLEKVYFSLV